MRRLAEQKFVVLRLLQACFTNSRYSLTLVDPHIRAQPLTHSLDMLMIMRRMNVFTQHYAYNLNMQVNQLKLINQ